jgi:acyl-CoA synthetase (NDP forming)
LADFSNPVDLVSLSAEDFKRVALAANKYDIADILLINFGDPVIGDLELIEFLDANVSACLVVSYFAGGEQEQTGRKQIQQAGFPVYPAPERAIRAIGAKVWETNYRLKRS